MIKKLLLCISVCLTIVGIKPVEALEKTKTSQIEMLENGYYFETTIEVIELPNRSTITTGARKTVNFKNSSGEVVWYVAVYGVFTYNGTTCTCTSSQVIANSNVNSWEIYSKSTSKSGNKASATATGKEYFLGFCINTITRTVTLTCDKNGNLS